MDPFLWKNQKPIDPSMLTDWKSITQGKDLSEKECLRCILEFITFQQKEFKFNLVILINDLNDFCKNDVIKAWEDSSKNSSSQITLD
jgi:hypothetical protein